MEWTVADFIPFVIAILVAIGALFMIDVNSGPWYGIGMALFAFAFLGGMWSVKRYFDRMETKRRH